MRDEARRDTSIVGSAIDAAAGLTKWLLRPRRPAILMYHRIAEEEFDPWGLAVSPSNFQSQVEWLARRRRVISLVEFAVLHRQGRLPSSAVAITFDDGYACTLYIAIAALERLRLPATIFLPAELIERGQEFWWDELERIVLKHRGPVLQLDGQDVSLGERDETDRVWPAGRAPQTPRQRAFHSIWSSLRTKRPLELDAAMQHLRNQTRTPEIPRPSHRPMTTEEIRSVPFGMIDFGSHALTHPSLPSLRRKDKAREITESVERCAALTGARPRIFAYPYGDFDKEAEQLVREAGFLSACTTENAFISGRSRRFALPRLQVVNGPPAELARMLSPP